MENTRRNIWADIAGATLILLAAIYFFGWLGLIVAVVAMMLILAGEAALKNRVAQKTGR